MLLVGRGFFSEGRSISTEAPARSPAGTGAGRVRDDAVVEKELDVNP
jgi:hypothetical protein